MRYELGKRMLQHGKTFVHDVTREGPIYAIEHLSRNFSLDRLHQRTTQLFRTYAQREAGKPADVTLPTSTAKSRLLRMYFPEVPPTAQDAVREVNVLTNDNTIDIRAVTHGSTFPLYMKIGYTATGMRVSSGLADEKASFNSKEKKYLSPFAVEVHNGDVLINGVSLSEFTDVNQMRTKAGRALKQTMHPRIRQMLYIMAAAKPHVVAENNPMVIMQFEAARFKLAEVLQMVSPDGTIHPDVATRQALPLLRRNEISADLVDIGNTPAIREKIAPPQDIIRAASLLPTNSLGSLITNLLERDTQNDKIHTAAEDLAIARWVAGTEHVLQQNEPFEPGIVQGESVISSATGRRKPRNTRPLDYSTKKLSDVA